MFEMPEFSEIPKFCHTECPVQCQMLVEEVALYTQKNDAGTDATDLLSGSMPAVGQLLVHMQDVGTGASPLNEEIAITALRESLLEELDELDANIQESESQRRFLGETCVGPQAVDIETRNGIRLRQFLCTSPDAYSEDTRHTPVHIDRLTEE